MFHICPPENDWVSIHGGCFCPILKIIFGILYRYLRLFFSHGGDVEQKSSITDGCCLRPVSEILKINGIKFLRKFKEETRVIEQIRCAVYGGGHGARDGSGGVNSGVTVFMS
jgi:hypothetical protein